MFVLARRGDVITLVNGTFDDKPKVGETFYRMPINKKETWIIVKVFDYPDQRTLEALVTLMGDCESRVINLFSINLDTSNPKRECW